MHDCDGIRWIKDIGAKHPDTEILVVSRQSEQTYAQRVLRAGASGFWMNSSSVEELMRAIATVMDGDIYVSPLMASMAVHKLARTRNKTLGAVDCLSDRELAVLSLIAAGHGVSRIANELGISRKTVESHCEHIKQKMKFPDAEALRQGARRLLGTEPLPLPHS
jgi:DNA-binding NarL/FixJ family response regulator